MQVSPVPSPSEMDVHHESEYFCVASQGALVMIVWGRDVVAHDLEHLSEVQRKVIAQHGHCVVISVIRAGLSLAVKEDVRKGGEANLREFTDHTLGSAMVVEAGGLRASFFRSVVTGIQLVTRSPVPQKVFDSIDEALAWLVAFPGLESSTASALDSLTAEVYAIANRHGQPVG